MPADPKILFIVTAVVLGALVAWVGWALARTETRRDASALRAAGAGASVGHEGNKAQADEDAGAG